MNNYESGLTFKEDLTLLSGTAYIDIKELKNSPNYSLIRFLEASYFGEVISLNKREGKGVMIYKSGRQYEGTWFNDRREGYGYERYANGHTYEGQYHLGKPHGKGLYTWVGGEQVYDGEWYQGMKHGKGTWIH
jgi:radial spoke head protein 1